MMKCTGVVDCIYRVRSESLAVALVYGVVVAIL